MRDALGGTVTIVIIVSFIVIVLGYLAFNVNYTKAFRMKDKIITLYEDYDGECLTECNDEIANYAEKIGYDPDIESCPADFGSTGSPLKNSGDGRDLGKYCVIDLKVNNSNDSTVFMDGKEKHFYRVATRINIDIPVIRYFIGDIRAFWIYGDTKTFEKDV